LKCNDCEKWREEGAKASWLRFKFFKTILLKIARLAAATTIAAQWQVTQYNLFLLIDVYGGTCGIHLLVPYNGIRWSLRKALKTAQAKNTIFENSCDKKYTKYKSKFVFTTR